VARHRSHLRQEPALTQAGPTLHQGDGSGAGEDPVKVPAQGPEFAVTAADWLRGHRSPGPDPVRGHYGPFDPVNVSDMSPGYDLMTVSPE
jgi:hypothetical protein